ncbi:MAG: CDP-archaeol synthase [Dehalococcoidia bacterium]|nr:CDP-archaeol synthase [Dehalococcoidia bacterium]
MSKSSPGMIWLRIASAAIGIPLLLLIIWLGNPVFSIVVGAAAIWGGVEFYGMAARAGYAPLRALGLLFILLSAGNAYYDGAYSLPLVTAAAILSLVLLLFRQNIEHALVDWAITLAGVIYTGWLLCHFILLGRLQNYGMALVLTALLATFAIDTAAFIVGSTMGRHRLAPRISPGKTWEGSIGGFVGGVVAVVILASLLNLPLDWFQSIALGALVGILAQVGDLVESLLKRSTNVKDASAIIPGHGGLLDRADSLIFSVVVVYYYAIWIIK